MMAQTFVGSDGDFLSRGKIAATTYEASPEDMLQANIVGDFKEEELEKMGAQCLADFEADVKSRAPRMKKLKDYTELYAMLGKQKSFPHHRAANIMAPLLTGPTLQIHARMLDMIWPQSGKLIHAIPSSLAESPIASITERFGNNYIRQDMSDMGTSLDGSTFQAVAYGSSFRRVYWCLVEGRAKSDWIPLEDFVCAYGYKNHDPSLRGIPRYAIVLRQTIYDIEEAAESAVYAEDAVKKLKNNIEEGKATSGQDGDEDYAVKQVVEKMDGSTAAEDSLADDKPRRIIEMHRIWRLPKRPKKNPAFDGKAHPVIIVFDAGTQEILRVVLREEPDPSDQGRFDDDKAEYSRRQAEYMAMQAKNTMISELLAAAEEAGREIDTERLRAEMVEIGEPPEPPRPVRKREICHFTHYRAFIGEGFYGLGLWDFLAGIAAAFNTMVNQHIDGLTFRNAPPGFVSRQMRMQRGTVYTQPGEITEVDAPAAEISRAIHFLTPPPPDPTTIPMLDMFRRMSDMVSGSAETMAGHIPKSNQSATGITALIEQANVPVTVIARRFKEAFRHEIMKIWRLWGVFLPEHKIVDAIGEAGNPERLEIGRWMFRPNANVVPAADPRLKAQRLEDEARTWQFITQNPYIVNGPAAPQFLHAGTENMLRAMSAESYLPILPPPPQDEPQQEPSADPAYKENAELLRGGEIEVHPADDHAEHLRDHQLFAQSTEAQALDKAGRDKLEQHIRETMAAIVEGRGDARQQQLGGAQGMGRPAQGSNPLMALLGGGGAIPGADRVP